MRWNQVNFKWLYFGKRNIKTELTRQNGPRVSIRQVDFKFNSSFKIKVSGAYQYQSEFSNATEVMTESVDLRKDKDR